MFTDYTHLPISVFNLEDFDIDSLKYTEYLKNYFFDLDWDYYLYRQQKLEYLIQTVLGNSIINQKLNNLFYKYYGGDVDDTALKDLIQLLNPDQREQFKEIKATRRRAMQAYQISCLKSGITINQINNQHFNQIDALVPSSAKDWRGIELIFKQPPSNMITDELISIIKSLVNKLLLYHHDLDSINLFVHFTQIVAEPNKTATNSPEGIHQDGMDYIVSALVVDRQNVCGGKSIICYGDNIKKSFFETILRTGYGILQPDKGTNLWHMVEPITPLDKSKPAYRSTIGFDFNLSFTTNKIKESF